jgi:hypothetical protein
VARIASLDVSVEPKLRFGPTLIMNRRSCCLVTDELPDETNHRPVLRINPGDSKEEIARNIAVFLAQLKKETPAFRKYEEHDLSWLERAERRDRI